MATDKLRVYCDDLVRASKTATTGADEIDDLRGKLGTQMDQLGRTWTGQAASAYLDVWADIDDGCAEMLTDLRWIGESTAAAANAYQHMDRNGANAVDSIRPLPPGDGA
jgi:WXG100 family type VII secretion target